MNTRTKVTISKLSDRLYRSLSIKERALLMDKQGYYKDISEETLKDELSKWKKEIFIKDDMLKSRLKFEDLTHNQFAKVLHTSKDTNWIDKIQLKEEHKPFWLKEIDKAFELNRIHNIKETMESNYSLSYAFRPFMLWASEEIKKYFVNNTKLESLINTDKLIDSLLINLEKSLVQIGTRTIVFELHVAKELEELKGNNTNERYNSFVKDKLMNSDYLEFIYSEYPVLARLLMTKTIYYINNTIQCIERFIKDYHMIVKTFELDNESLTSIETDLGDSHQKGKTVMRFQFSSGKEILYKPKSLQLLKNFNNLLDWFNSKGFKPEFKNYKTINYKDYCWEERVEYNSCDSDEQLERYYKRLGGLLGVLYMINGVDFHSENIIANGEHPILIDLETLFHHRVKFSPEFTRIASLRAKEKLNDSVLSIGLLPHLSFKNAEGKGIDLGGMSITEAVMPIPLLSLEGDQTDEVRFIFKDSLMNKADQNVPKLGNEMIDATNFVNEITEGFYEICKIILKNKNVLTNEDGILSKFKQDVIRVILRGTQYYGNFILESTHPDYLRDWIERDKLMEKLWVTSIDSKVIPYEKYDLLNNDIPFFYTTPNNHDLISSDGKIISDFYNQSSYSITIDRIENLTEDIILEQINLIEMSILSQKNKEKEEINHNTYKSLEKLEINTECFIKEATIIGDKLLKQAIQGESNDVTWISLDINYFGQWDVSVLKDGLYNGLSGILMFTTYLYKVTQEERFKDLAEKTCESILKTPIFSGDFQSAFFGQTSVIYALSHYMKVFGHNEKIISYIKERIRVTGENAEKDEYLDLLGGSAGIIQILLNTYDQLNLTEALEYAKRYGNHLLDNQQVTKNGVGWSSSSDPTILGGFSHGTSGIAWSLLRLYKYSHDKKYLEAALKAIEFDRSLFNSEKENWDDLRNKDKESISWCHGAPGIGMSRILYLEYLHDSHLNNEIETALSTTLKKGLGKSHSLCHGDLGNSELFCLASLKLNNTKYLETAREIGMHVIKEKNEQGKFLTGVTNNIELPGLFLGLSGIGLQLLRLADPENVPSVLILQ
ncbi:type 2 lanthipeptide synthetase LanM family protein [Bacillus wiedmannii]|uniref:type 2 lanthipeptide synthetase LanM family protein n=1 Tax=Bacillus wiedmannii TaxID=1890302 RepID=UPI000D097228|nr:type 2 lanthipeptide synthetase LanM family protein [Bacillus wiedmannii]PRT15283.1 type 2 lantipeptide synthetase LanM [Bacillus wiedmannii]